MIDYMLSFFMIVLLLMLAGLPILVEMVNRFVECFVFSNSKDYDIELDE